MGQLKETSSERDNLSESIPMLTNRMLTMLKIWQKNVGAKFDGDVLPAPTEQRGKKDDKHSDTRR